MRAGCASCRHVKESSRCLSEAPAVLAGVRVVRGGKHLLAPRSRQSGKRGLRGFVQHLSAKKVRETPWTRCLVSMRRLVFARNYLRAHFSRIR